VKAVGKGNKGIRRFDTSCFSGEYVTGDVTRDYLDSLESRRNDVTRTQRAGGDGRRGGSVVTL
jgi:amidophosphoribosyltransferase